MPRVKRKPADQTDNAELEGEEEEEETAGPATPAARKAINQEAESIHAWLQGYGSTGDIRVALYRRDPKRYKGVKTDGLLETWSEPITHEQVQELHGGGKFQIQVHQAVPNKHGIGQWRYAGSRQFDIAGPPRLSNIRNEDAFDDEDEGGKPAMPMMPTPGDDPLSQRAMSLAESLTRESREEAAELRRMMGQRQADPAMLAMIEGLQSNLTELQRVAAEKDNRLLQILNQPKDNSQVDQLVQTLRETNHDHAQRIAELRAAHDSELRNLRQFHQQELSSQEKRLERQQEMAHSAHQRELDAMRDTHRSAFENQKQAYETRIESLKDAMTRTERELHEAKTELATLRARKDAGPLDQIEQLVALKAGMETLMPSPEPEGDDKSTLERIVSTLMQSPVAQGVAQRLAGPAQVPDERMVSVRRPDGRVAQLPESYVRQQAAAAAEARKPPKPGSTLKRHEVQTAISYLEQAYRNGTEPRIVAASARNLVPMDIQRFIGSKGVDVFLNDVAQLSGDSPLATVLGRQYARKVADFLLNGTDQTTVRDAAADDGAQSEEEFAGENGEADIDEFFADMDDAGAGGVE
jgi:hypothetical protein